MILIISRCCRGLLAAVVAAACQGQQGAIAIIQHHAQRQLVVAHLFISRLVSLVTDCKVVVKEQSRAHQEEDTKRESPFKVALEAKHASPKTT